MPAHVILGSQWGDEGKGRIVDVEAEQADIVTRFQGGANAGHTLVVDGEETVLHVVPSGILHPHTVNVVANGVFFDPVKFKIELDGLYKNGIDISPNRIKLSNRAPLILPEYIVEDSSSANSKKIGTTKSGIGQTAEGIARRDAIRIGDVLGNFPYAMNEKIEEVRDSLDASLLDMLRDYSCDTRRYLVDSLKEGKLVIGEGAQGYQLDNDHGTYPFVTSTHPTVPGFINGTGIPYKWIEKVLLVVKAYTTRVGEGPFFSELKDEIGEELRRKGKEVGTTTGRPRRCGYLNLDEVNEACEFVNGPTGLALTKLDILSGFEEIKVFVYGEYQTFSGWSEDISGAREFDDLPQNAQFYVQFIEGVLGVPFDYVSVGAERNSLIR